MKPFSPPAVNSDDQLKNGFFFSFIFMKSQICCLNEFGRISFGPQKVKSREKNKNIFILFVATLFIHKRLLNPDYPCAVFKVGKHILGFELKGEPHSPSAGSNK